MPKIIDIFKKGRTIVPDKYRSKSFIYPFILCCMTLDNLNITGALTTSFSIARQFNASSTTISWVLSAYALTLGSFIIFFGKLADVIGVHTVFLMGISSMSILSLITAAIENSAIAMIVFRALQGISAAALMPSGYALTANYFQGPTLGKAIRALAVALTSSFGLGTVLGGAFSLTNIGYKGFFYFTFSASALCSIILYFIIIPIEETEGHKNLKFKNLDFAGVTMLVISLLLIIFGLTEGGVNWNSPKVYVTIPIGVVFLIIMLLFETVYLQSYKNKHQNKVVVSNVNSDEYDKEKDSVSDDNATGDIHNCTSQDSDKVDWRLSVELMFPKEVFGLTNFFPLFCGVFLAYFACIGIMSVLIQYHMYVEYNNALLSAVKVLPISVGFTFGSLCFSDKIVKFATIKVFIILSALIQLGCSIWLSRIDYKIANTYWKFEFISQFIWGWSCNWFFLVYLNAIMSEAPLHLQGVVSGIFQTGGQVAVAIASAIVSSVLGELVYKKGDASFREDQYSKFHNTFYIAIAGNAAFFLATFLVKNPKPVTEQEVAANEVDIEANRTEHQR